MGNGIRPNTLGSVSTVNTQYYRLLKHPIVSGTHVEWFIILEVRNQY
jgi:hypothetical protein